VSDREHVAAMFLGDCRALGVTEVLGRPVGDVATELPTKDLAALRRTLAAAPVEKREEA